MEAGIVLLRTQGKFIGMTIVWTLLSNRAIVGCNVVLVKGEDTTSGLTTCDMRENEEMAKEGP